MPWDLREQRGAVNRNRSKAQKDPAGAKQARVRDTGQEAGSSPVWAQDGWAGTKGMRKEEKISEVKISILTESGH